MTELHDRELEQYLRDDTPLSRRYRQASAETAPPELDEVILAQAKAELGRKPPSLSRYLAPVALAASLVLAVNLAWNLYQAEPPPGRAPAPAGAPPATPAPEIATAKPEPRREVAPPPAPAPASPEQRQDGGVAAKPSAELEPHAVAEQRVEAANRARRQAQDAAGAAAPAAVAADAAPLPESRKIDRLIAYIAGLDGAVFIRNGEEHSPAEAAEHLALKRDRAGDRVRTAEDFIRLCASHSSLSGEAYLIRLKDGRTRTAEDVLREELARLEGP